MFKFFRYIAIISGCFLAFNCHPRLARVSPGLSDSVPDNYYRDMHSREVERIDADYIADCKIRIRNKNSSAAGSCGLVFTRRGGFRFTIFHPLGEALSVFYMDRDNIQILYRNVKKFYQLPNNRENRKRILPIADISLNELQDILWGRKILSNNNQLKFLPVGQKTREVVATDKPGLIVKYLKWLKHKGNLFPKVIEMEDVKNNAFLKIVITWFSPGTAGEVKINNIPENYQRLTSF